MVRRGRHRHLSRHCFPHTRGDGPRAAKERAKKAAFSPHAWGWSGGVPYGHSTRPVFPTRVGMVRYAISWISFPCSFPHTRGDGPWSRSLRRTTLTFSPHAWGWSVRESLEVPAPKVFPTRVGMVRWRTSARRSLRSFPHTRGDGPPVPVIAKSCPAFSPHAWGWSGFHRRKITLPTVFPTRVGMVRESNPPSGALQCFPHTRGDGPPLSTLNSPTGRFSPHAWGWSVFVAVGAVGGDVFPTRVGMVRHRPALPAHRRRFPHTRGDGPQRRNLLEREGAFSPHAWGWSVLVSVVLRLPAVFPTRVGMVRLTWCTG